MKSNDDDGGAGGGSSGDGDYDDDGCGNGLITTSILAVLWANYYLAF